MYLGEELFIEEIAFMLIRLKKAEGKNLNKQQKFDGEKILASTFQQDFISSNHSKHMKNKRRDNLYTILHFIQERERDSSSLVLK